MAEPIDDYDAFMAQNPEVAKQFTGVTPAASTPAAKAAPVDDDTQFAKENPHLNLPIPNAQGEDSTTVSELPVTGEAHKGVGRFALDTVENIPESGWNFIKGLAHVVAHPVQTAETVGMGAAGAAQHLRNILPAQSITNAPGTQIDTKDADAIGHMFKDRYWGKDERGNLKVLHTIKTDPVGFLADLSAPLTAGGSTGIAIADALANTGRLGEVAGAVGKAGEIASAVGKVADPLNVLGKDGALSYVPKVVDKIPVVGKPINSITAKVGDVVNPISNVSRALGVTTGQGRPAIEAALKDGAGANAKDARSGMRGGDITPIVEGAAKGVDQYSSNIPKFDPAQMGLPPTVSIDPLKTSFQSALGEHVTPAGTYKTQLNPKLVDAITGKIKEFGKDPSLTDVGATGGRGFTPNGLATTRTWLSNTIDSLPKGSDNYKFATKVLDGVDQSFEAYSPSVRKVFSDIDAAKSGVSDMRDAINSGKKITPEQIQAFADSTKNTPLTKPFSDQAAAFGRGTQMSTLLPHGAFSKALELGGSAFGGLLAGHEGNLIHGAAAAIPSFLMGSPRVVGEGLHALGQGYGVAHGIASNLGKALDSPYGQAAKFDAYEARPRYGTSSLPYKAAPNGDAKESDYLKYKKDAQEQEPDFVPDKADFN